MSMGLVFMLVFWLSVLLVDMFQRRLVVVVVRLNVDV